MTSPLLVMLAGRVRQERLRLGWTQAVAASHAGISARAYQRFEQAATITLRRLEQVLGAFGLSLAVATPAGVAPPAPDPRLARQRGLRPARPPGARTPASGDAPKPPPRPTGTRSATPPAPSPAVAQPPPPGPAPAAPVDPARVALITQNFRQKILNAMFPIVANAMTNTTAYGVVANMMSVTPELAEADRPAFVAAVAAQLDALTPETIAAYSIGRSSYERWASTWNRGRGIIDVMATR